MNEEIRKNILDKIKNFNIAYGGAFSMKLSLNKEEIGIIQKALTPKLDSDIEEDITNLDVIFDMMDNIQATINDSRISKELKIWTDIWTNDTKKLIKQHISNQESKIEELEKESKELKELKKWLKEIR